MTRTDVEEGLDLRSTLPFFEHRVGPMHEYRCERTGCSRWFYTAEPLENATAPCPHCFKVSRVPDHEGENDES